MTKMGGFTTNRHISVEYLRSAVTYDPDTGGMRWNYRHDMTPQWNGRFAGKSVGTARDGYIDIRIKGRRIPVHRAAWAIMTGVWPEHEIDHRDTIKSHNWWGNLREASPSQNRCNRGAPSDNTSGYKGVTFCKQTCRWLAQIGYAGQNHNLGRFDTREEAYAVYCAAAKEHHKEFANLGDA